MIEKIKQIHNTSDIPKISEIGSIKSRIITIHMEVTISSRLDMADEMILFLSSFFANKTVVQLASSSETNISNTDCQEENVLVMPYSS